MGNPGLFMKGPDGPGRDKAGSPDFRSVLPQKVLHMLSELKPLAGGRALLQRFPQRFGQSGRRNPLLLQDGD